MNRDKIGTQTCYIHQCATRYVDVHSMSVSQSCLCPFLCNPYIHFKFPKFFIYLFTITVTQLTFIEFLWSVYIVNVGVPLPSSTFNWWFGSGYKIYPSAF